MALEEALDGIQRKTPSYSIYASSQEALSRTTWSVSTPAEANLLDLLESLPRLSSLALVRQGIITGADDVFLLDDEEVPADEGAVYRPLLPDRLIGQYRLPAKTGRQVFYPYLGDQPLTSQSLLRDFPRTWSRLEAHRETLSNRSSSKEVASDWWQPSRMRNPSEILAPKIVTPEVVLTPRFSADISGTWIVSHSPFIVPQARFASAETLLILTAILNSNLVAWYIDLNSRKYGRGYNKIGVGLLRNVPIPDLGRVRSTTVRRISSLVRRLMSNSREYDLGDIEELDQVVCTDLYHLSSSQAEIIDIRLPTD